MFVTHCGFSWATFLAPNFLAQPAAAAAADADADADATATAQARRLQAVCVRTNLQSTCTACAVSVRKFSIAGDVLPLAPKIIIGFIVLMMVIMNQWGKDTELHQPSRVEYLAANDNLANDLRGSLAFRSDHRHVDAVVLR